MKDARNRKCAQERGKKQGQRKQKDQQVRETEKKSDKEGMRLGSEKPAFQRRRNPITTDRGVKQSRDPARSQSLLARRTA